jgi:phosphoglycerate dehydrogenase-like enzyme
MFFNSISNANLHSLCREPLPQESPLWSHPSVFITPHVSGISFAEDVVKIFVENLSRFVEGKELKYVVDLNKGY